MLSSLETKKGPNLVVYNRPSVLVVDDNPDAIKLLSLILNHHSCVITRATDGIDAVEQLLNHEFDLVILDIELPRLNGDEALSFVDGFFSKMEKTSLTPVLVYSGRELSELNLPKLSSFKYLAVFNKRGHYRRLLNLLSSLLED